MDFEKERQTKQNNNYTSSSMKCPGKLAWMSERKTNKKKITGYDEKFANSPLWILETNEIEMEPKRTSLLDIQYINVVYHCSGIQSKHRRQHAANKVHFSPL